MTVSPYLQQPIMRWLYALTWTAVVILLLLQSSSEPVIGPASPPGIPSTPREALLTFGHFGAFFVMTFLLWWALVTTTSHLRALLMALVIALFLGTITEILQSFVPSREASLFDLAMNWGATLCVAGIIHTQRTISAK
jgi:VanZ family protein